MNRILAVLIVVCFGIVCSVHVDPSLAQNDSHENVVDIIMGFDDGAPAEENGEDPMQGFEDESAEDSESRSEVGGILERFEEEAFGEEDPETIEEKKPASWRLDGNFVFTTNYNFSSDARSPWRGVSMLRSEIELTLKNKFSTNWQGEVSVRGFYDAVHLFRGRDEYTRHVLDEYEMESELEDIFIEGRLTGHLDVKMGRQIVAWGPLDNLRVTDVLNPLDMRVPGLTDIDDLRLPVTMVKFNYYAGHWALTGMLIPEVRFSKQPVFGSDFFPSPSPGPPEDMPEDGFKNPQYAGGLTGVFSGWDIGFYWANIYADQPYLESDASEPPAQLILKHTRINMLGTALNLAAGNWLMKAEAAWVDGLRYTNRPGHEYTRLDLGAGVEYSGFSEATVSLEAANRYLFDYHALLKQSPDEISVNAFQWAVRITKEFLNDTLTLTLIGTTFGISAADGAFERLDAEYDINDAVSIRGGIVLYQSGDKGVFRNVGDNDRLFAVLKYSF